MIFVELDLLERGQGLPLDGLQLVVAELVDLMPTMSDLQVQLGDVLLFDLDLAQVHIAQLSR